MDRVWIVVAIIVYLFVSGEGASAAVFTSTNNLVGPDSVITFETGSTGLPGVSGLTFSDYGTQADATFTTVLFGNQAYGNLSTANGYTDLKIRFSPLITEIGAWGASSGGPSQLQVNVYGIGHQLLDSGVLPLINRPVGPDFLGFFEAQGIEEIDWIGGNQGFFLIDNVTYGGPAPVPEPDMRCPLLILFAAVVATARHAKCKRVGIRKVS